MIIGRRRFRVVGITTKRTYLPVFVITLLIAWAFLAWLGDYNIYVGDIYQDGRAWVKLKGTTTNRMVQSLAFAVVFAAIEIVVLWCWNKFWGGDKK